MNLQDLISKLKTIEEGADPAGMLNTEFECGTPASSTSDQPLMGEDPVDECGMDMMPHQPPKQSDSVTMSVSMNGSGSGGIKDLIDILKNIEQGGSHGSHNAQDTLFGDGYANEPNKVTLDIDSVTGTGNDLASKGREAEKVNGGGNPMGIDEALTRKLQAMYNDVKAREITNEADGKVWYDPSTWVSNAPAQVPPGAQRPPQGQKPRRQKPQQAQKPAAQPPAQGTNTNTNTPSVAPAPAAQTTGTAPAATNAATLAAAQQAAAGGGAAPAAQPSGPQTNALGIAPQANVAGVGAAMGAAAPAAQPAAAQPAPDPRAQYDKFKADDAKTAAIAAVKKMTKPSGEYSNYIDPTTGIIKYQERGAMGGQGATKEFSYDWFTKGQEKGFFDQLKAAGLEVKPVTKKSLFGSYQVAGVDPAQLATLGQAPAAAPAAPAPAAAPTAPAGQPASSYSGKVAENIELADLLRIAGIK